MEIKVRADRRILEIWLTNKERQDPALKSQLKLIYQQCNKQNYLAAVFLSGERDVIEQTGALLCRNRTRSAELEVQRERTRRESLAR